MEFADLLFEEEVWFIVSCAPSLEVSRMESGMAEMVKHVLRSCFFIKGDFISKPMDF